MHLSIQIPQNAVNIHDLLSKEVVLKVYILFSNLNLFICLNLKL